MKQGAYATIVGFVATEPKIHFTGDGGPMAKMRVGSTTRRVDRETGEWRDGDTSFFSVACWRSLASNTTTCLHKGQPVVVTGKLRESRFEDRSGRPRSELEIVADTVSVDLNRGVTHFTRTAQAPGAAAFARGEAIRSGLADDDGPDGPGEETGPSPAGEPTAGTATAGTGTAGTAGTGAADADEGGGHMFDYGAIAHLAQELGAADEAGAVTR